MLCILKKYIYDSIDNVTNKLQENGSRCLKLTGDNVILKNLTMRQIYFPSDNDMQDDRFFNLTCDIRTTSHLESPREICPTMLLARQGLTSLTDGANVFLWLIKEVTETDQQQVLVSLC